MHGIVCPGEAVNWDSSLNRGLVSWWMALPDQQRGNVFRDLCGRNDGAVSSSVLLTGDVGRPGGWGSIQLDGSTSGSVAPANFTPATISLWFNTSSVANNGDKLAFGNLGGPGTRFYIRRAVGNINFLIGNTSIGSTAIQALRWYHALATFDGTTAYLYIDGVQRGTTSSSGATTLNTQCRIGSYGNGTTPWQGWLDDVRRYDRFFPDAGEVEALRKESAGGYKEALNWYKPKVYFDTGGGGGPTGNPWYYQHLLAG